MKWTPFKIVFGLNLTVLVLSLLLAPLILDSSWNQYGTQTTWVGLFAAILILGFDFLAIIISLIQAAVDWEGGSGRFAWPKAWLLTFGLMLIICFPACMFVSAVRG